MGLKESFLRAMEFYEVPENFYDEAKTMLKENEIKLIDLMNKKEFSYIELKSLIKENFQIDEEEFLKGCYRRAVIKKVEKDGKVYFSTSDFYTRLTYFAQYEPDEWKRVPQNKRKKLDEWCFTTYIRYYRDAIEKKIKGEDVPLHNSNLVDQKESEEIIDKTEREIYLQPCNCKAISLNCDKLKNVCIQFGCQINTPADRGLGEKITKEKAKEVLREASKNGLMHTAEGDAICNCDAGVAATRLELPRCLVQGRYGLDQISKLTGWKKSAFTAEDVRRCAILEHFTEGKIKK